jgi:hypothetical protein
MIKNLNELKKQTTQKIISGENPLEIKKYVINHIINSNEDLKEMYQNKHYKKRLVLAVDELLFGLYKNHLDRLITRKFS